MREPIQRPITTAHLQAALLQIVMTVIGGVALGLLILQVLASREHGFVPAQQALFEAPAAPQQPAEP